MTDPAPMSQTPPRPFDPVAGALWMLASAAAFTIANIMIRPAAAEMHPLQVVFFRNVFGIVFMAPILFRSGFGVLRTKRLKLHLARGCTFLAGMTTWFWAVPHVPLVDAIALFFLSPLLITILAASVLGERVRVRRWSAVVIGFAGALLVLQPGAGTINAYYGLLLLNAVIWSLGALILREASKTEKPTTIVAHMYLWALPVSILPALLVWRDPSLEGLLWCMGIGFMSTLAHLSLARAFATAEASFVIPFDYSQLVFGALMGFAMFGEIPAWSTVAGSLLIVGAALYIARRESALARRGGTP